MSTPITDATYEAVRSFTNEEQAVDALVEMRETSRKLERENAALQQRIADDNKAYGCELRDPSGTIWDHAKRLHEENAALREDRERLDWLSKQSRIDYSTGYWRNTDGKTLRSAIDAARNRFDHIGDSNEMMQKPKEAQL